MGSNSGKALNAEGRDDLLKFRPESLIIVTDPSHPLFDERIHLPLDESLVRSIMAFGVKIPIHVVRGPKREDGSYDALVENGRQRVRACIEANKRLVAQGAEPHLVRAVRSNDTEAVDMMSTMIVTNEFAQADAPSVKAKKARRYMAQGRDEKEAAELYGVTVATIRNWLALDDAPIEYREAVDSGRLGATHVASILKLPGDKQEAAFLKVMAASPVPAAGEKVAKRRPAVAAALAGMAPGKIPSRKRLGEQRTHVDGMIKSLEAEGDTIDNSTYDRLTGFRACLQWILGDMKLTKELDPKQKAKGD